MLSIGFHLDLVKNNPHFETAVNTMTDFVNIECVGNAPNLSIL